MTHRVSMIRVHITNFSKLKKKSHLEVKKRMNKVLFVYSKPVAAEKKRELPRFYLFPPPCSYYIVFTRTHLRALTWQTNKLNK